MILAIESDKRGTGISITDGESIISNKEVSVKGGGRASSIQNCIDPIKETDYTGKIREKYEKYKEPYFSASSHIVFLLEHLPATNNCMVFPGFSTETRDFAMIFPKNVPMFFGDLTREFMCKLVQIPRE